MLPRHNGEERSTIRKLMARNYIGEATRSVTSLEKLYGRVAETKENRSALGQHVVYDAFCQKYYSAEKLLSFFTNCRYTESDGQLAKAEEINRAVVSASTAGNMIHKRYEPYYEPYARDMNFLRPSLSKNSRNER